MVVASSAIVIEVGVRPEASCSCDIDTDVGIEGDGRIFPLSNQETNQSMLFVRRSQYIVDQRVECRVVCVSPRMYVGATYNVGQRHQDQREYLGKGKQRSKQHRQTAF